MEDDHQRAPSAHKQPSISNEDEAKPCKANRPHASLPESDIGEAEERVMEQVERDRHRLETLAAATREMQVSGVFAIKDNSERLAAIKVSLCKLFPHLKGQ